MSVARSAVISGELAVDRSAGACSAYWGDEAELLPRHLLRARDLADTRYFELLTVADLAGAANMSRSYFSRRFSETFGESPHQYLLTRRLERAAALMRVSDWSVANICFAVGWNSVGSFTTSFRRCSA